MAMRIAVFAALKDELDFPEHFAMEATGEIKLATCKATTYARGDMEIILAVTGMGKVNAAAAAASLISIAQPSLILNVGSAGALSPYLRARDMVIVTEAMFHDYDLSPFGYAQGYVPNADSDVFASHPLFLDAAVPPEPFPARIHYGRALSGDCIIASESQSEELYRRFGALVCDMETAALAQVCTLAKVPFGAFRAVSDSASQDMKGEFETNIAPAASLLGMMAASLLDNLGEAEQ